MKHPNKRSIAIRSGAGQLIRRWHAPKAASAGLAVRGDGEGNDAIHRQASGAPSRSRATARKHDFVVVRWCQRLTRNGCNRRGRGKLVTAQKSLASLSPPSTKSRLFHLPLPQNLCLDRDATSRAPGSAFGRHFACWSRPLAASRFPIAESPLSVDEERCGRREEA